jgi:hypothetical protein
MAVGTKWLLGRAEDGSTGAQPRYMASTDGKGYAILEAARSRPALDNKVTTRCRPDNSYHA